MSLLRKDDRWDDGIGLVNLLDKNEGKKDGPPHHFSPLDRMVYERLAKSMRKHGFMIDLPRVA